MGLYVIGVPYPLLWAALGAALRFIPYVGPVIAAGAPILIALAALPGWTQPLWVVAMFVGVELFTNLVLETVLYAGAAGVSQVALLIAVAFWTWLWGPMGLLMATPLTVCLVVHGQTRARPGIPVHVDGRRARALARRGYYQRLLARDQGEAFDIIEKHIKTNAPETVYDAILVPALNYAERDRLEERLSAEQEKLIVDATRELMNDAMVATREARAAETAEAAETAAAADRPAAREELGAVVSRQQRRGRSGVADARAAARGDAHRDRGALESYAGLRADRRRSGAGLPDRLHRGFAAEPAVQDAIPDQEAAGGAARREDRGRPLGARGAGRRGPAAADGCRRHACGLDDARKRATSFVSWRSSTPRHSPTIRRKLRPYVSRDVRP